MSISFDGERREVSSRFRDSARLVATWSVVAIKAGRITTLGAVHSYMSGTGGTFYAAVYVYGMPDGCAGYGKASGYGYNKRGAAIRNAMQNAGIAGAPNAEAEERTAIRAVFEAAAETQGIDPSTVYLADSYA